MSRQLWNERHVNGMCMESWKYMKDVRTRCVLQITLSLHAIEGGMSCLPPKGNATLRIMVRTHFSVKFMD